MDAKRSFRISTTHSAGQALVQPSLEGARGAAAPAQQTTLIKQNYHIRFGI